VRGCGSWMLLSIVDRLPMVGWLVGIALYFGCGVLLRGSFWDIYEVNDEQNSIANSI
jgi:hypothetical protein